MTRHVDPQFAGTTDKQLAQIVREWDEWVLLGNVADDALLRLWSSNHGREGAPTSMIALATHVFREIIARHDLASPATPSEGE